MQEIKKGRLKLGNNGILIYLRKFWKIMHFKALALYLGRTSAHEKFRHVFFGTVCSLALAHA